MTAAPKAKASPTLARTTVTISRLMEFFTEKELQMQIGHGRPWWPVALVKELIDNALDACENNGILPEVTITVEEDAVTVSDNGRGLPPETLKASLDYLSRTSDKNFYVSPTRGQLGNALKCVWAAPFVIDGEHGRVEVATGGMRYVIDVTLDRVSQTPRLDLQEEPAPDVKNGTSVRMNWADVASSLIDPQAADSYNDAPMSVIALAQNFAVLNLHLSLTLETPGEKDLHWERQVTDWRKWRPNQLTDPNWYNADQLGQLIAGYLVADGEGRTRSVREFVAEFAGLSGTAKQKVVGQESALTGLTLRDLVRDGNLDREKVRSLLWAMQDEARPLKPAALGIIGEEQLVGALIDMLYTTSVHYHKEMGTTAEGLPFVVEAAFGVNIPKYEEYPRELIVGVNWSTMLDPRGIVTRALAQARVDPHDPVAVIVHVASPAARYTDRGKTTLESTGIDAAIEKSIRLVTRAWTQAKRHEDRNQRVSRVDIDALRTKSKELKINAAAWQVMEEAYEEASGGGQYWANARQIMYSARRRVLALTGGKVWKKSSYFTQTLLPNYREAHPETDGWLVAYDARGHITEPHTGARTDLGTIAVLDYLDAWHGNVPSLKVPQLPHRIATRGPKNRYKFALFVEKEGFDQLLDQAQIEQRFDIAVMSTKGMSVMAARKLVDRLSQEGVTILVLRDFDKSGFSILSTLGRDSRRYKFEKKPSIIDLGLRFADVTRLGLEDEPVEYKSKVDPAVNLAACGATPEECAFLVTGRRGGGWTGRRVELNAMSSTVFVALLEQKLVEAGALKLVPDDVTLAAAYRRAVGLRRLQAAMNAWFEQQDPADAPVPDGLAAMVATRITDSTASWDDAVWELTEPHT